MRCKVEIPKRTRFPAVLEDIQCPQHQARVPEQTGQQYTQSSKNASWNTGWRAYTPGTIQQIILINNGVSIALFRGHSAKDVYRVSQIQKTGYLIQYESLRNVWKTSDNESYFQSAPIRFKDKSRGKQHFGIIWTVVQHHQIGFDNSVRDETGQLLDSMEKLRKRTHQSYRNPITEFLN